MIAFYFKRLALIVGIVAALLMIPFIFMQLSGEVHWSTFDFVIIGALLFMMGLAIDLIIRKAGLRRKGVVYLFLVLLAFLLVWVEIAVGIFGTPFAGS